MGYFNFFEENSSNEYALYNDNTLEYIEQYGIPVIYLPRTSIAQDDLFGEDDLSTFDEKIECKMLLDDYTAFGGQQDFFSKFGLEIDDTLKLKIQQNYMIELLGGELPEIGDLIQFKFNKVIFEISFVEDEEIFYLAGGQTLFTFSAKKWNYSGEILDTGDINIDILEDKISAKDDSIQTFTDILEFNETDPFNDGF